MADIIAKEYYNPETGFVSKNVLYNRLKSKGITRKQINTFFETERTTQRFKKPPKKPILPPIMISHPKQLYEADLIDYARIKNHNNQWKYILVVIDDFTKKVYARELKNKTAAEIHKAFTEIFKVAGNPQSLMTDQESGITSKMFQKMLKDRNIEWVNNMTHAPTVERVIGTLKNMIQRYFEANNTKRWKGITQQIVKNYNNKEHSTIGMKPNEVIKNVDDARINIQRYQLRQIRKVKNDVKFNVGDKVRVLLGEESKLTKGYKPKWSNKIYTVKKTGRSFYVLDDNKKYRPYQMYKVGSVVKDSAPKKTTKPRQSQYKAAVVERPKTRGVRKDYAKMVKQ